MISYKGKNTPSIRATLEKLDLQAYEGFCICIDNTDCGVHALRHKKWNYREHYTALTVYALKDDSERSASSPKRPETIGDLYDERTNDNSEYQRLVSHLPISR
ncbi:hypothetical protein [Dubosiella newyorkensis]|uniref:hypothetical protein n=1 Tax=Dubosiella newyorkensis TaxID=1862672 RepID=UPI003F67D5E2